MRHRRPLVLSLPHRFALALAMLTAIGCTDRREQCRANANCSATGNGGEGGEDAVATATSKGSGTPRQGGESETSSGGTGGASSSSKGGESSTGVGGSSAETTAPFVPCSGECKDSTPVCDTATNHCVECVKSDDCKDASKKVCSPSNVCVTCSENADCRQDATKPVCDTSVPGGACVECTASTDCKDATKALCDTSAKACVSCLANTDCKDATKSLCDTEKHECAPCKEDSDCSQIDGKHVCNAGSCVQCTGKKYADCGLLEGKALVCESKTQSCTTDKKAGTAGLCQPCVSDAQCKAGQLCAEQRFGGKPVGHFCFFKQGDTEHGAPAKCFAEESNRPYVKAQADMVSIDGEIATLCTLRTSTCVALSQYSTTNCAPSGTPDNSLCGFAAGEDSKCAETSTGSNTYRCTTACMSLDDCRGSTGDGTTSSPFTCVSEDTKSYCSL